MVYTCDIRLITQMKSKMIRVKQDTIQRLKELKLSESETYDIVINRLFILPASKILKVKKAIESIEKGK